jgi:proton glutamate symport protein
MRIRLALHWQMMIALLLALACGLGLQRLGVEHPAAQAAALQALQIVGALFLRALKMIVLPLVMTSLVCGMAGLGTAGKFGRVGLKTFAYYLATTTIAVTSGLVLVNVMRPGVGAEMPLPDQPPTISAPQTISELVVRIVPENVFQAMAQFDMLGAIFFALVFGLTLNFVAAGTRERLLPVVAAVLEVMMRITHVIILFAPLGVFALVSGLVAETGWAALRPLIPYALTVAAGLATHYFVSLPVLLALFVRVNPYRVMRAMSAALITAFSTASSSATLPLTMERAQQRVGVSNRVASFVLPLGATINMDGTALYECVAVIFLAQVLGVELSAVQQVTVFVGAVLISIGAAGIPHAGLVMMTIILSAVGLPVESAAMIWAVDRVLDMCRTSTNVWSDVTGSLIIAASEGEWDRSVLERPAERT